MGTDLSVVNGARVSHEKQSGWIEDCSLCGRQDEEAFRCNMDHLLIHGHTPCTIKRVLSPKDERLIGYLAEHNHWTPFAHAALTFRVKVPIFVARQLAKHQIGLVVNEVSRRYVDSDPEFFTPDAWRKRADNVKQGSSEETIASIMLSAAYRSRCEEAVNTYKHMLADGVCPEQARMVLPLSTMTEWIWTGSLAAFSRVCRLRLDPHTQKETRLVAQKLDELIQPLFPVSWKVLTKHAPQDFPLAPDR